MLSMHISFCICSFFSWSQMSETNTILIQSWIHKGFNEPDSLTPWTRILCKKLINKLPAFYRFKMFINVFIRARPCTLFWTTVFFFFFLSLNLLIGWQLSIWICCKSFFPLLLYYCSKLKCSWMSNVSLYTNEFNKIFHDKMWKIIFFIITSAGDLRRPHYKYYSAHSFRPANETARKCPPTIYCNTNDHKEQIIANFGVHTCSLLGTTSSLLQLLLSWN
jgi:hypothetical protein